MPVSEWGTHKVSYSLPGVRSLIRPRTVQLAAAGTGMGCEMDQTDQEELVAHWISKLWECVSTASVCEARRGKGQQR